MLNYVCKNMKCRSVTPHLPCTIMSMMKIKCGINQKCQKQVKIMRNAEVCETVRELHEFSQLGYKFSPNLYKIFIGTKILLDILIYLL